MEAIIYEKLKEKGLKNNIDIFKVEDYNSPSKFIVHYFDGEMDFERHKPKEKTLEVDAWTSLDEVITKIKLQKYNKPSTQEPNKVDLLKELLNNPRVESISINIERAGEVEKTHINAKLKETEWLYMDESKIGDEEMKKFKEALKNMPPSTINIFNNGDTGEKLKPPSTGSGIK